MIRMVTIIINIFYIHIGTKSNVEMHILVRNKVNDEINTLKGDSST